MVFPVIPVSRNRYSKPNTQLTIPINIDGITTNIVLLRDIPIKKPTAAPIRAPVHGKGSQINKGRPHVPYFAILSFCLLAIFIVEPNILPKNFTFMT